MELEARQGRTWALFVVAATAALLLFRLSGFGIWDPWELETADAARRLLDGEAGSGHTALSTRLTAGGFALLGVSEWAGRLPIALSGVLFVLLVYLMTAQHAGRRTGVYAAAIAATSPLFLFNARAMLGEAPAIALQTALAWAAGALVLNPQKTAGARSAAVGLLVLVACSALGVAASGALLGALPPLLAATGIAVLDGQLRLDRGRPRFPAAWGLLLLTTALGVLLARDVLLDAAQYSPWTGGRPAAQQPPGFDSVIQRLFHAFAPWSALLPLALAHSMAPVQGKAGPHSRIAHYCLLWAALGCAANTFFVSRYGSAACFLPVAAISVSIALLLRDAEQRPRGSWAVAVAGALLCGLLIRDYALFPSGPADGLPVAEIEVPKVFNPRAWWAALLGVFTLATVFGLGLGEARRKLDWRAPYRLLRTQWKRGRGFRAWLSGAALVLLAILTLGVIAFIAPSHLGASTLTVRWFRALTFVPPALPLMVLAAQVLVHLWSLLGQHRMLPLFASAMLLAVYATHGYLPALSGHFSPREIYQTYNALSEPEEVLVEYQVGGRAARYYADGDIKEVKSISKLMKHLKGDKRRWAAFPTDELGKINRQFRQQSGRHLFVADARSARVILAANHPVEGVKDQNPISPYVHADVPKIGHPVKAILEDKVEFLGYDLKLPHDGYVGAGESFEVTWYFRTLKRVGGNYKMFIHIDGNGQRIHGDHHPIDGKLPMRLWDPGDVITDTQKLDVPGNYRAGSYTMYLGFYSGDTRLKIGEGPKDDADRIRAGVLRIR